MNFCDMMYRDEILDHWRHPQNFGRLEGATEQFFSENISCGDRQTVYLTVREGKIVAAGFEGSGCAISIAASSLLTGQVKGKTVAELKKMKGEDIMTLLGGEVAPGRVKCALLGLQAMQKATEK